WVVAAPFGVAEARPLLAAPNDFDDRRVEVDRERLGAGTGARSPRSSEDHLEGAIELAHVTEAEGAQECPQRRGRHHPLREHAPGLPAAKDIGILDRVTA